MSFKALLLDIEGTITSISFVKDVLFPYASNNVASYLTKQLSGTPNDDLTKLFGNIRETSAKESTIDPEIINPRDDSLAEDYIKNILHWIKADKKITCLKELQGLMWEEAYVSGEVKGHLYEDVVPVLKKIHDSGIPIYIYSSGSVKAQKLLFGHSVEGDITGLLSGYFDTNVGLKGDDKSYTKICSSIGKDPKDVLFLSDIPAEAVAATTAGLQAKLVIRPGNAELDETARQKFQTIKVLDEIL